jgi:hypothetical protein
VSHPHLDTLIPLSLIKALKYMKSNCSGLLYTLYERPNRNPRAKSQLTLLHLCTYLGRYWTIPQEDRVREPFFVMGS